MQKNKSNKFLYLVLTLSFVLLVIIIAVMLKFAFEKKYSARLAGLERTVFELRSSVGDGSERQYQIQKSLAIMDDYNLTLTYPEKFEIAEEIYSMASKYEYLNVELICALVTFETGGSWNPDLISSNRAMGLMQIMPINGLYAASLEDLPWIGPVEVLLNPIYNIRLGCRYLESLIKLYNVEGGLVAYHAGERLAAKWLELGKDSQVLPKETLDYVDSVTSLYQEFQMYRTEGK